MFKVEGKSPSADKTFSYLKCLGSELNIGHCMFSVNGTNGGDVLQQYVRCGDGKFNPVQVHY